MSVTAPSESSAPVRQVIEPPGRGWSLQGAELWRYRELLFFLTWRDVKIRYKQTVLGFLWAFVQPFAQMLVFSFIFGHLVGVSSEGYPYPIYVFAGLLPWQFFSSALNQSGSSVVSNANLVTKVYFPRLIIPVASTGGHLFTLLISFAIMAGMMLYYQVLPGIQVLMVLPLIALLVLTTLGLGILLSALTTAYRDFRNMMGFIVQLAFFLTPVIYPVNLIPRWMLYFNPMAGVVDGFRAALLGKPMPWDLLGSSLLVSSLMFVAAVAFFRRMEHRFADIV